MCSADSMWCRMVLLLPTWSWWACASAMHGRGLCAVTPHTEAFLPHLNLLPGHSMYCRFHLLIASPCFVLVFSFLRTPLKRVPAVLLGNTKCTVAIPLPQSKTVRDGDCVYNFFFFNLTTKGLHFNSKAVHHFAFLFREKHIKFS